MTRLLLLFNVFIGSFVNAQKKYHFDYALLYKNESNTGKKSTSLYFINSRNNTYQMYVHEDKDSIDSIIHFVDYKGITSNSKVNINLFYKAETITNDCGSVLKFTNQYKYNSKNYTIEKYKDTLINDTTYFHYSIKSLKSLKYQKRKKIQTEHFIIDKESSDFKPFLYQPLLYNLYTDNKTLPNGKLKMSYYIDVNGKLTFKRELYKAIQSDKYLTIPEECDYTKTLK